MRRTIMRVLEVSRYKSNFADHQLPFVTEQGEAIARELRNRVNSEKLIVKSGEPSAVEYFLVKGIISKPWEHSKRKSGSSNLTSCMRTSGYRLLRQSCKAWSLLSRPSITARHSIGMSTSSPHSCRSVPSMSSTSRNIYATCRTSKPNTIPSSPAACPWSR